MNEITRSAAHRDMAAEDARGAVAVCQACGGKYRPAGGPCIHEHPQGQLANSGPVCCLACGVAWRPGHVCVAPALPAPPDTPHCVGCWRLVEDMSAEEIFNSLRVATSWQWGETRRVICPTCQDKEERSE